MSQSELAALATSIEGAIEEHIIAGFNVIKEHVLTQIQVAQQIAGEASAERAHIIIGHLNVISEACDTGAVEGDGARATAAALAEILSSA